MFSSQLTPLQPKAKSVRRKHPAVLTQLLLLVGFTFFSNWFVLFDAYSVFPNTVTFSRFRLPFRFRFQC